MFMANSFVCFISKRNCVDVETGGLISKVLLANADALCAAVSPLMDVEEDPS